MHERERERALTPGEDAQVSQTLALARDVESAWPYNSHFNDDVGGLNTVIQERVEYPWQHLRTDRAYILWPEGRATEIGLWPEGSATEVESRNDVIKNVIKGVAELNLPKAETWCDRCYKERVPAMAVALVAAPRHIVAIALCGPCVMRTDPDELLWIRKDES